MRDKLDVASTTGPLARTIPADEWRRLSELEQLFRGDLGDLLRSALRSEFKIFNAYLHLKKGGDIAPKLWHSDSGPGTCLNVFVYLSDGYVDYGPTALLPWRESEAVFRHEPSWMRKRISERPEIKTSGKIKRNEMAAFYDKEISSRFPEKVEIPNGAAGLMVVFNNNILHAAGSAKTGCDRLVAIFRVFPSIEPLDFKRLAKEGIPTRGMNNPRADDNF